MATLAQYKCGYKSEREARKYAENALKDKDVEIATLKAQLEAKIHGEQSISTNLGAQVIDLEQALLHEQVEHEETKKSAEIQRSIRAVKKQIKWLSKHQKQ